MTGEPTVCSRCGREAPKQLDGTADDPRWAEWEVSEYEKARAGEPAVICPGCLTDVDLGLVDDPLGGQETS
jgi:hypothetical protein